MLQFRFEISLLLFIPKSIEHIFFYKAVYNNLLSADMGI